MIPEFFCAVLNSALVLKEVRHFTGGAAAPHLNIGDIRRFPVPVPPITTQQKLVEKLASIGAARQELEATYLKKARDLDDLRHSLLQCAFAGELTRNVFSPRAASTKTAALNSPAVSAATTEADDDQEEVVQRTGEAPRRA